MNVKERPVGKFGGTSMATPESIMQSGEIVVAENMRAVIVSAPGKRNPDDTKVTDLLLVCNELFMQGKSFDQPFNLVSGRFEDIGRGLKIHTNVVGWLDSVHRGIVQGNGRDWTASRGEWTMAQIFARHMGGVFRDAASLIRLKDNGQIDPLTYEIIKEQLTQDKILDVIPGFYGATSTGVIRTFARGGSDITGAIIARGLNAKEYQNWTDVDGVKAADPRVVFDAKTIKEMTFREMRELSYRGAGVLQMDAVLPVAEVGIPVVVRNTFNPTHKGTRIVAQRKSSVQETVIGIAAREGFVSIQIGKSNMNTERGIAGRILECFEEHGVSIEHDPTGIDTMSVIVHQSQLDGKTPVIMKRLKELVNPDEINVIRDIGLVCIVGQQISRKSAEIFVKLADALHKKSINISSITYPTQGNSIIVGVNNNQTKEAIGAIYAGLLKS